MHDRTKQTTFPHARVKDFVQASNQVFCFCFFFWGGKVLRPLDKVIKRSQGQLAVKNALKADNDLKISRPNPKRTGNGHGDLGLIQVLVLFEVNHPYDYITEWLTTYKYQTLSIKIHLPLKTSDNVCTIWVSVSELAFPPSPVSASPCSFRRQSIRSLIESAWNKMD